MAHEHIHKRIQQHHREHDECNFPHELIAVDQALCDFIVLEIASAEQRGYDRGMNPEREEIKLLHRVLRLLERLVKHIKPESGFTLLLVEPDEPMKGYMPLVKLTKPLKPGFRRPISLSVDEDVDVRSDGSFAAIEIVSGDSTGVVRGAGDPTPSTAKQINIFLNGDGALGDKVLRVKADGHIGEGEAEISVDIAYTVAHPDATAFGTPVEGADEPIPGVTPPTP